MKFGLILPFGFLSPEPLGGSSGLEGCLGYDRVLPVTGGGRGWLAKKFPKEGGRLDSRLSSVSPEAEPTQPLTPKAGSGGRHWRRSWLPVPLEPDPRPDSRAEFPETPISGQPTFLIQWTPNILRTPTCKGPVESSTQAGKAETGGRAGGARMPAQTRAAPSGRCSARLCPTGTSTAPRSARRSPAQPKLLSREASLTLLGFGFRQGGL